MVAALCAAVPGTLAGGATPARAAQVLDAWQSAEVGLYEPHVTQMVPRDGRLAGYGFTSVVTGVAFAGHAGGGDQAVNAGDGDQLVVVSLAEHDDDQSGIYAYYAESSPDYALVSGTHQVTLAAPESLFGSSESTVWAVSVPKGAPAVLKVSRAGFSQSFDLRTGKRLGASAEALYRGGNSPEVDMALLPVQFHGARAKVLLTIEPRRRVVSEGDPTGVRADP